MKRKLMVLLAGILCVFMLTSSLVASNKPTNKNSARMLNSLNAIKTNIPLQSSEFFTNYKKLSQICETSLTYDCSEAMEIVGDAAAQTYAGCSEYGWLSEYCGELVGWLGATSTWALYICARDTGLVSVYSNKLEQQNVVGDIPKNQKISSKLMVTNDFVY